MCITVWHVGMFGGAPIQGLVNFQHLSFIVNHPHSAVYVVTSLELESRRPLEAKGLSCMLTFASLSRSITACCSFACPSFTSLTSPHRAAPASSWTAGIQAVSFTGAVSGGAPAASARSHLERRRPMRTGPGAGSPQPSAGSPVIRSDFLSTHQRQEAAQNTIIIALNWTLPLCSARLLSSGEGGTRP